MNFQLTQTVNKPKQERKVKDQYLEDPGENRRGNSGTDLALKVYDIY